MTVSRYSPTQLSLFFKNLRATYARILQPKFSMVRHFATLTLPMAIFLPQLAMAHYTVQNTGDLIEENQLQFATELQFKTSGDEGVNALGRFIKGFDSDGNLEFVAGGGTTDYEFGALYKWVPIPDYENQPAIGFTFGVQLARFSNHSELTARFIPFTSKKFATEKGDFTPFVALPMAFSNYDGESFSPVHLVLGSRYHHPEFETCDFTAEVGFDLHEAFSYISVGAIFPAFEWSF